eukprot:TRINITY_DN5254_c0_g1_i1.p1 TRINITY_DN5254_c0_g1~~TRINITY_DN5254_c0_g1_i1.p1  ORF type:complete len:173 (+),score=30.65 TRINITY_DN5254_c0_g1_i1:25-519(+)
MFKFIFFQAVFCFYLCLSSQLEPDAKNPCVAYGNGTVFDISSLFSYPVVISDDPRNYTYWWNPCSGYKCNSYQPPGKFAICQKADQFYGCGLYESPIWLLQEYFGRLTILYPGGFQWRMTSIEFIEDKTIDPPTIQFKGEEPYLQYNFEVRGKCVGLPKGQCFS